MRVAADNKDNLWIDFARESLTVAASAIEHCAERLDSCFLRALELLDHCSGKVITTGVGKSGIAAKKMAATLTSTGCPSIFLHPSEAMHGDLGIVEADDVVIAYSNGGESEELLAILPFILSRGVPILAIVGNLESTLARKSNVFIDAGIERESCPHNLAPTTSVVAAMALGDALAMTLQKRRGFSTEDYAKNHPGGRLGRRLTLRVQDVMPSGEDRIPQVGPEASMTEVLSEISRKHLGAACVLNSEKHLLGIITDFDFRQALQSRGAEALSLTAAEMMNPNPAVVLAPEELAFRAMERMEGRPRPLSVAPVVAGDGCCVGMVNLHVLLQAGL